MGKTVTFYRTEKGKCPIQEFLDSLPGKVAQKVLWVISLLEDLEIVPSAYFKKLSGTEEIWECRIQYGSNISDILFLCWPFRSCTNPWFREKEHEDAQEGNREGGII
jgi:hypothetical protein